MMKTIFTTKRVSQWFKPLAALSLVGLLVSPSFADDASRIGVVNSQRLLAESNMAKNSQNLLEKEFSTRSNEIQEQAKQMQALVDNFEKDAPVLSESERAKRQKDLMAADAEFRRKQAAFTNDLNQRKNEELSKVLESANAIIRKVAEQRKLDLIVQDVVYFNPKIDITEEVLRDMNKAK